MPCDRGERALIVDDVLATGGTAAATCRLVERLGATSSASVASWSSVSSGEGQRLKDLEVRGAGQLRVNAGARVRRSTSEANWDRTVKPN